MDTLDLLARIHAADRDALAHVSEALPAIAAAAGAIADRLKSGGRWFYAGAGTSGRLAALDAAELGPTFGMGSDRVIALLAGGPNALRNSVEAAEDDEESAIRDLQERAFGRSDALLAIAASGATPYTLAALRHARAAGACTVAFTCTGAAPMNDAADHAIVVPTGDEVVRGSTRMKAGTVQKMVLTLLSTAVMHRLGLVYQGEMVAMRPTNAKLRARAAGIVMRLTDVDEAGARTLLEESAWDLPIALLRARFGDGPDAARARLAHHRGSVAAALAEGDA